MIRPSAHALGFTCWIVLGLSLAAFTTIPFAHADGRISETNAGGPDPAPDPVPGPEPDPDPAPEPGPEPDPDPAPDPDPEPDAE
jgi:hypothetical protein